MYRGNAEQMFRSSSLGFLAYKDLETKINGLCRDVEINLQPYNTSFVNKNLNILFAYFKIVNCGKPVLYEELGQKSKVILGVILLF